MTYIQPNHHKNILNLVLAGLLLASLVGVFSLVALYNNTVNLSHNIAAAKAELDSIGAKNTKLNSQVIASLGNIQSGDLVSQDGLVQDNHPQYLSLTHYLPSQSWPIASQR